MKSSYLIIKLSVIMHFRSQLCPYKVTALMLHASVVLEVNARLLKFNVKTKPLITNIVKYLQLRDRFFRQLILQNILLKVCIKYFVLIS